ncbi:MAG TPA: sulfotransferase domain-containing protein [Terriglobia bacterium]|nr:sulfotransferase domain-containing protein [Terriglobia bacterium]
MGETTLVGGLRRPLVKIGRIVLRRELAGRQYTPFADDICLVAYPKSGNTWLRFLVGNLVDPDHPVTFANIESRVPSIYHNPDHILRRIPRPRILKSHEGFFSHHRRVVYIVRDPRDIAVSYYHYLIKFRELPDNYPMEAYVPRFMREDFDAKYGPWDDHVLSWIRMREGWEDFLLVRYEDLLKNTSSELGRVAVFLKLATDGERIDRAITLSAADRLRKLERKESRKWSATRNSRHDLPFVRSARSGDGKRELSETSIRLIETEWGAVMQLLGYELSQSPQVSLTEAWRA